jgi:hypothetical protein
MTRDISGQVMSFSVERTKKPLTTADRLRRSSFPTTSRIRSSSTPMSRCRPVSPTPTWAARSPSAGTSGRLASVIASPCAARSMANTISRTCVLHGLTRGGVETRRPRRCRRGIGGPRAAGWILCRTRSFSERERVGVVSPRFQPVLKEHGIDPAPTRGQRMSWAKFMNTHWPNLTAVDFFTVPAVLISMWITSCLRSWRRVSSVERESSTQVHWTYQHRCLLSWCAR